jgi:nucleotide-binding universal stress UspA family protein
MLRTLLVPLDGSVLAEQALPYASGLACAAGARLLLVRATLAHPVAGVDEADARAATVERAEVELGGVAERLKHEGLAVEPVVYYAEAADAILEAARERQADLIVMSTLGRTGLGRWIYGSVANRVLQRAEVPLLLVPASGDRAWAAEGPRCILVPLDGSTLAEEALAPAQSLADLGHADLLLVRVVEPVAPIEPHGGYLPPLHDESELNTARQYLEHVASMLRSGGRSVSVQVVEGSPAAQISAVARERQVDLIAMATHGRGSVAQLVMGSVAAEVLRQASSPLLVVRPTAVREAVKAPVGAPGQTAGPPVLVQLTEHELMLVQQALETRLSDAEREAGARVRVSAGAQELSDLLAKLQQAETAATGGRA